MNVTPAETRGSSLQRPVCKREEGEPSVLYLLTSGAGAMYRGTSLIRSTPPRRTLQQAYA